MSIKEHPWPFMCLKPQVILSVILIHYLFARCMIRPQLVIHMLTDLSPGHSPCLAAPRFWRHRDWEGKLWASLIQLHLSFSFPAPGEEKLQSCKSLVQNSIGELLWVRAGLHTDVSGLQFCSLQSVHTYIHTAIRMHLFPAC